MRIAPYASALGIALCLAAGMVRGTNWALASASTQDDGWTVIEYPEGQEVIVDLKPVAATDATGKARVKRTGSETTVSLDVSGVSGDATPYQVYVVDALGNATLLGALSITDGSGSFSTNTALSKFMIVISPEADLTTIGSETKVAMRSAVPSGLNVVARESNPDEGIPPVPEPVASNSQMETNATKTSDYDVPLLDISSFRRGADTLLKTVFSPAYEFTYAYVTIRPQNKALTQIKLRFNNFKPAPEGSQYFLWAVSPDSSYTVLGRITLGKKNEVKLDVNTAMPKFGLFITTESADSNAPSPVGSLVATIVE